MNSGAAPPITSMAALGPARLPPLAAGAGRVMAVLGGDDIDMRTLIDAVQQCPSVAARLMRVANSAWSTAAEPVDSIDAACARLGLDVVRSIAIALATSGPFTLRRCGAFDFRRFWSSALLSAEGADWTARLEDLASGLEPNVARTAGLLHNLGLLWLADRLPEQTSQALQAADEGCEPAVMIEIRRHCGVGYDEVGGYLAESWGLSPLLCAAMRHRQSPEDDGRLWLTNSPVGIAVGVTGAVLRGADGPPPYLRQENALIRARNLDELYQRLRERAAAVREMACSMTVNHA